jgi:glycosyltransferase involved in cell wall biosynthesis
MALRIRFEFTRYPHLGAHSGYSQLVRHLDPRGYRARLCGAADTDAGLPRWLVPARPLLRRMVRRGRMPWYKLSDLGAEINAMPACLAGRLDILHFLDGEHSGQYLPRLIKRCGLSRPCTIATFHQPPDVVRELIDVDLLRWLDRVLLVSPSQRAFFARYVPEGRLRVILHGVDTEFFYPSSKPNTTNAIRCITVGHWMRDWETFKSVVTALSSERGISFHVVASHSGGIGSLPNVRIHSGIDDASLAELYRSADVLFLPLLQSTANNALLEGMASGLAVLTSDLEAVRAYLPQNQAILLKNRPDAFVAVLRRLQRDVNERHDLGRRARARAEELAWPRIIRQYEALYDEVASGTAAS